MPRRRSRGAKFAQGLGQGLSDASSALLRFSLQNRQNDQILDRQTQAQTRAFMQTILTKVAEGAMTPEQAAGLTGGSPEDFTNVQPSLDRRMEGTIGQAIGSADTPEAVPSLQDILGRARLEGVEVGPSTNFPADLDPAMLSLPSEVQPFQERAQIRRRSLQSKPSERIDVTLPTGATATRFVSPYDVPSEGLTTGLTFEQQGAGEGMKQSAALGTGPSPEVLGERAGVQAGAAERSQAETGLTPEERGSRAAQEEATKLTRLAPVQARVANIVDALTRESRAATAGAIAGATKRAGLAPDIITGEVAREGQMADVRAGHTPATAAERTAASNLVPLIQSHDTALTMESQEGGSVRLQPFAYSASNSPTFNRFVSEPQKQYIQAAKEYINILGKIMSGVTVREDERDNFLSSMFAYAGDSDEVVAQKQAARETFIASAQIAAGRSAGDGARALAKAINEGVIDPRILTTLQMDPDFEQALVGALDPRVVPQVPPPEGGQ